MNWPSLARRFDVGRLFQKQDGPPAPGTKFSIPKNDQKIPPGHVKLRKMRGSNYIEITYPTGEFERILHHKRFNDDMIRRGIDPEKVESIVDFVWNFGEAIVRLKNEPTVK